MDRAAYYFWTIWPWLYPGVWAILAGLAFVRGRRSSAVMLFLSAAMGILHQFLFYYGSPFTKDWETDSPLNVAFSYHPLGFILANGLAIGRDFLLLATYAAFFKQEKRA